MQIKATPQGVLVYATMLAYLAAGIVLLVSGGRKRLRLLGRGLYALGFLVAVAAVIYRWDHVDHLPLQNLFEVFLFLGMLMFPLSGLCRRLLSVGGDGFDALIGAVILFPAGFVFSAEPQQLPPALQSWLFAPHVAAYMAAYVILFKAAVQAVGLLTVGPATREGLLPRHLAMDRVARMGFPLLTLGLILGAVWGKLAWGDWWNWDPKEMWSLATWLVFAMYFHLAGAMGRRWVRPGAGLILLGNVLILVTLLWANLGRIFKGLHNYAA
jgi:ABC-type transport system involved in cytochrome c biogenesis permease subunit